ncbi:unnamed protein product [Sphacelaria rigidula]
MGQAAADKSGASVQLGEFQQLQIRNWRKQDVRLSRVGMMLPNVSIYLAPREDDTDTFNTRRVLTIEKTWTHHAEQLGTLDSGDIRHDILQGLVELDRVSVWEVRLVLGKGASGSGGKETVRIR